MINLNLLPESMRKSKGLPRKQLLTLLCLVAALGGLVYMLTNYMFVVLPGLRQEQRTLARTEQRLKTVVRELTQINAEIDRMAGCVNAVKSLYRQRTVWAKILADVKNIVNFDPEMSEYNAEQRYLWLTRFSGREKTVDITAFATAASQVVAMQMPERLLQGFREYSPVSLPEKDGETRLQEELKQFQPGGIALKPFAEFVVPGSLRLRSASWTPAPRPGPAAGGPRDRTAAGALFPANAWNFTITMTLK